VAMAQAAQLNVPPSGFTFLMLPTKPVVRVPIPHVAVPNPNVAMAACCPHTSSGSSLASRTGSLPSGLPCRTSPTGVPRARLRRPEDRLRRGAPAPSVMTEMEPRWSLWKLAPAKAGVACRDGLVDVLDVHADHAAGRHQVVGPADGAAGAGELFGVAQVESRSTRRGLLEALVKLEILVTSFVTP